MLPCSVLAKLFRELSCISLDEIFSPAWSYFRWKLFCKRSRASDVVRRNVKGPMKFSAEVTIFFLVSAMSNHEDSKYKGRLNKMRISHMEMV